MDYIGTDWDHWEELSRWELSQVGRHRTKEIFLASGWGRPLEFHLGLRVTADYGAFDSFVWIPVKSKDAIGVFVPDLQASIRAYNGEILCGAGPLAVTMYWTFGGLCKHDITTATSGIGVPVVYKALSAGHRNFLAALDRPVCCSAPMYILVGLELALISRTDFEVSV